MLRIHQFKVYGTDINDIQNELEKLKSCGKIIDYHCDGAIDICSIVENNINSMILNGKGIPPIVPNKKI